METLIPELYYSYGSYKNQRQMIVNSIDGCIPVWRRCLLGVHENARSSYKKTASVLGYVMQHYHPHSEASGTMEVLVRNKFVQGQGQWGSTLGVEEISAAATRYTEVKAMPLIEEIAFKYIDYVPWMRDELDPEPVILPTMFPICLFAQNEFNSIAFGFKTSIPNFKIKDLYKRLMYLLNKDKDKNVKEVIISPNIIGCDILSTKSEIKQVCTEPESKIKIKGKLVKDPINNKIYIQGWSPRTKFATVYKAIDKNGLISNEDIVMMDESTDEGNIGTNICFEVNRSRNKTEIYKKMEEAIDNALTANIDYKIFTVDTKTGNILSPSVDTMLINTYTFYKNVLKNYFTKSIEKLTIEIEEMNVITEIRKHISNVMKNTDDVDLAVKKLAELTKFDEIAIKSVVEKYRIKKLLTVNTDTSDLKEQITIMKGHLKNVDTYALEQYATISEMS